jgi:hypothetical protein
MKSTLPLLVLIRLEPAIWARRLFDQLRIRLDPVQGVVLDCSDSQAIWFCPDPTETFDTLHALLAQGFRHRFDVHAAVVQAIVATGRRPESAQDFTEQTVGTLLELADHAGPQQIAVSAKLLSLLRLAVPDHARAFELAPMPVKPGLNVARPMLLTARSSPVTP